MILSHLRNIENPPYKIPRPVYVVCIEATHVHTSVVKQGLRTAEVKSSTLQTENRFKHFLRIQEIVPTT